MRGAKALMGVVAVLTAAACGNSSDSYSIVVVKVTAPPALTAVTQLRADITNAGKSDTELFPKGQPTTSITFDASFALALPTSRLGQVDLTVSALDSNGHVLATGAGSVQIVVGGRVDVTIHLALSGESDAGAQMPLDSASLDMQSSADAPSADGRLGQETLAYDSAGGTDVPLTGGAGGAGGSGGQVGTGGGGGIDAGADGSGGKGAQDGGVDLGSLAGSGGVHATGGAGGIDAPGDVPSGGGAGGIHTEGGAGGSGGLSATGGIGGVGGVFTGDADGIDSTGAPADAGAPDAPLSTCSSSVSCPSYPNCQGQPICNTATGLCSAPTRCSVCGNGTVEFSEQCDDGNTLNGDHCSSTCRTEFCGDGIVQGQALASLSLVYLARSCNTSVVQDIWLLLNGTEVVRGAVQKTCDCQPGIVTLPVTDPTLLALSKNGGNVVEVHTAAEISWAVVHYESPSGGGNIVLVDYGSNGAAQYQRPNLCTNGSQFGADVAATMTLAGAEECDDGNNNGVGSDPCSITCMLR